MYMSLRITGGWGGFICLTMAMCLSYYLRLVIQSSIVDRSSVGRLLNRLSFAILTLFVGRSSSRLPLVHFGRVSWRPGAQGRAGFQLCPVLIGGSSQQRSGVIPEDFEKLEMMMEGVVSPFWGFINEVTKVFYWASKGFMYGCIET